MHFSRLGIEKNHFSGIHNFASARIYQCYFSMHISSLPPNGLIGSGPPGQGARHHRDQGAGSSAGMGKDVVAEMPQVSSVGSALQRAIGSMELGLFLPLSTADLGHIAGFC